MSVATSHSDMYRQCVGIAIRKDPSVAVPSKSWFTPVLAIDKDDFEHDPLHR